MEANVTLICEYCGELFERLAKEHRRNSKAHMPVFCSLSCATKQKHVDGHYQKAKKAPWPRTPKKEITPFHKFMRSMKKRNHDVNVDATYLKSQWESQNGICHYTGREMFINPSGAIQPWQASVERVNNNLGYVSGNIVFCCYIANICKSSFSMQTMVEFCSGVIRNLQ